MKQFFRSKIFTAILFFVIGALVGWSLWYVIYPQSVTSSWNQTNETVKSPPSNVNVNTKPNVNPLSTPSNSGSSSSTW